MPFSTVLSIVSPVYGAPELIDELVQRIRASADSIGQRYEIVLVDDCSPGDAWPRIATQAAHDGRVRGLRLRRNVGQHMAIVVGLAHARGEWVVVLDCDLQDRPEDIKNLWNIAQSTGADQVLARRLHRPDSWVARAGSWLLYKLWLLTGRRHNPAVANFGLYRRRVIDAVLAQRTAWPFFSVQAHQAGGPIVTVAVAHAPRGSGRSSYSLGSRVQLALQVLVSTVWPTRGQPTPNAYFVAEITPSSASA